MDIVSQPIDPNLTKEGAFSSLSSYPNGKRLKPRLLGRTAEFNNYDDFLDEVSIDFSNSLDYGGFVEGESTVKVKHIYYDMYRYSVATDVADDSDAEMIMETLWGSGVRVKINAYIFDQNVKVDNFLNVAAACEYGQASANFSVEIFGINDPKVALELPGPGVFDLPTASKLYALGDAIKNDYITDESKRFSVPFRIKADSRLFESRIKSSQSVGFAISMISEGKSLKEALVIADEFVDFNLAPLTIVQTYHTWQLTQEDEVPNDRLVKKAKKWF